MTKTTRINPGIYDVIHNGQRYELEQYEDGAWLLFQTLKSGREYLQDFATKRAAIRSIQAEG